MKKWIILSVAAGIMTVAQANVLVYEGFDYPVGILGNGNGGTGWSSEWGQASWGSVDGAAQAEVGGPRLGAPADYALTPVGGCISDLASGGTDAREFKANEIDLGTDTVRYFSFLWNESGAGNAGNITVAFLRKNSKTRRIFETVTVNSQISLRINNSGDTVGSKDFVSGNDYLLVGKITATAAGADTVSFSIFKKGAKITAEPATWDVSGSVAEKDQDGVINRIMLQGSNNTDMFDEFIIGETFADVTGIQP